MSHATEHEITVAAPARVVYDLIADVGSWPRIFPPTVYVDYAERGKAEERIRIWATANGEPKGWTSRRYLDADNLRVRFRQEVSQPPVAAMGGEWLIEPLSGNETRVRLTHDFDAVGDDPEKVGLILKAIDLNSGAELGALKSAAERHGADEGLLLTFTDTVRVDGAAKDLYDFIYDAGQWQSRLPHVARIALQEDTPNVQLLEMDTSSADNDVHTTKSVRICFPADRIVYKQIRTPALMKVHTGQWSFGSDDGTAVITSAHTVVIDPGAITTVLGRQATVKDARKLIREALGRNSIATMRHAKAYAEGS
ncbi:cyclase [Prauserella marina]|uniref:Aromatase/bifunctional aromatase (Cyclase/dehydratase) n=1 Tax=Prauserella marina TaxID=530584 RepID=A0A222VM93_9PSEU|nr:aromatase/cyclase [Prauserella marina]ASR34883.1 cyclase [Prauserella marina]PWV85416.1 aromatase/bifunctional aromatase (cyclase/dehydratase) [Prauserella marina]SDC55345.1 aromatase/bifunctional aromatase (cyclase/dehydratase) [Prauserella marina]